MINRAGIILRYKAPAVRWINEADPYEEDPGITLDSVNKERTIYLVMDHCADNPELLDEWINDNFDILFEMELDGWYTDEELWPMKRDRRLFNEWFEVECHSVIEDTVNEPIEDEET